MDTLARFQGCILGLAIGDALGKAGEFLSRERIIATYGGELREFTAPQNYMRGLRPEQFTDDTLMTIIHTESIIASGKVDPDDIAARFIVWYDGGDLRGIGNTVAEAIERLKAGSGWQESGKRGEHAAGNGTAMRIAPIGLLHYADVLTNPDALRHDARVASVITHNNAEAVAGSRAVAYALARLAAGDDSLDSLIENTVNFIGSSKVGENLVRAEGFIKQQTSPEMALAALGTTGYVVHTVASAFYCFLHSADDFEQTVVNAVMGGDDADTTAAIAGALSGAYNGIAAIPARWLDEVEDRAHLADLAGNLYLLTQTQEIR